MTVISCETPTPQCSLCRHFIRHSVDRPGELSISQPYWLILETKKIVLGSMTQLGSPARCQADHSRRVGIAAYIPGIFPSFAQMRGRAEIESVPTRPLNHGYFGDAFVSTHRQSSDGTQAGDPVVLDVAEWM